MEKEIQELVRAMMKKLTDNEKISGFGFVLLCDEGSAGGVVQGYFGEKIKIHGALMRLEREVIRHIDEGSGETDYSDEFNSDKPFIKTTFEA